MSVILEIKPEAGPALVVGGGAVAARKTRTLVEGGFRVTVVAPELAEEIAALPGVETFLRQFEAADVGGQRWGLVFACTNNREVNRLVGELARQRGIPVLVADSQEESTFTSPATYRDGGLQVAVSTGGADPALARSIRERVVAAIGDGWAERIASARQARRARLEAEDDS